MTDPFTRRAAERIVREGVDSAYALLDSLQGQIIEQSRARQQAEASVERLQANVAALLAENRRLMDASNRNAVEGALAYARGRAEGFLEASELSVDLQGKTTAREGVGALRDAIRARAKEMP